MTTPIDHNNMLCMSMQLCGFKTVAVEHKESQHVGRQDMFLHITDVVQPGDVHTNCCLADIVRTRIIVNTRLVAYALIIAHCKVTSLW